MCEFVFVCVRERDREGGGWWGRERRWGGKGNKETQTQV